MGAIPTLHLHSRPLYSVLRKEKVKLKAFCFETCGEGHIVRYKLSEFAFLNSYGNVLELLWK